MRPHLDANDIDDARLRLQATGGISVALRRTYAPPRDEPFAPDLLERLRTISNLQSRIDCHGPRPRHCQHQEGRHVQ